MIDLLLYIGSGILAAFVASFGGHVATQNKRDRWIFYFSGALLAGIIITSGVRNYLATLIAETPKHIVMEAVSKANEHSDKQIAKVKDGVEVVNANVQKLHDTMEENDSSLSREIGKVSPVVPGRAQLAFSFFTEDDTKIPVTTTYAPPGEGGYVSVDLTVKNVSKETSTAKGNLWIRICLGCQYHKDLVGFFKRDGMEEHERNKPFENLDAGVSLEKMTVSVLPPKGVSVFFVLGKYSCQACGPLSNWQTMRVQTRPRPEIKLPTKRIFP
jgi:hypothetical protein